MCIGNHRGTSYNFSLVTTCTFNPMGDKSFFLVVPQDHSIVFLLICLFERYTKLKGMGSNVVDDVCCL